jgi:hypothetical protein
MGLRLPGRLRIAATPMTNGNVTSFSTIAAYYTRKERGMNFDDYEAATRDPWSLRYDEVTCIWCQQPMLDNVETAPYCSQECSVAAERDDMEDK